LQFHSIDNRAYCVCGGVRRVVPSRSSTFVFRTLLSAIPWFWETGAVDAQPIDERLVATGAIAGQPATFILDTGAQQGFVIAAADAKRFGLQPDRKPPPEAVLFEALSKPVRVVLPGGDAEQVSFAILKQTDAPGYDVDALIGWPALKAHVTHYDKHRHLLAIGSNRQPHVANARSFPILPDHDLVFNAGTSEEPLPVFLDSGWSGGVMLSKPLWDEWRRQNRDVPYTYSSVYWYATGWVTLEQLLASDIRVGSLRLKNVLVSPLPAGLTDKAAMIGLGAFANHALVVDGPENSLQIDQADAPLVIPNYNRLGASFGTGMAARVAPESPAAQADIRDGDVLIAINGMTPDAYAATVKGQVWEQPAGTAVQLSLRRGSAAIDRRVELQDFLTARQ
jgi:hypothetical protein